MICREFISHCSQELREKLLTAAGLNPFVEGYPDFDFFHRDRVICFRMTGRFERKILGFLVSNQGVVTVVSTERRNTLIRLWRRECIGVPAYLIGHHPPISSRGAALLETAQLYYRLEATETPVPAADWRALHRAAVRSGIWIVARIVWRRLMHAAAVNFTAWEEEQAVTYVKTLAADDGTSLDAAAHCIGGDDECDD